jgi:hypothetical protein
VADKYHSAVVLSALIYLNSNGYQTMLPLGVSPLEPQELRKAQALLKLDRIARQHRPACIRESRKDLGQLWQAADCDG